MMRFLVPVCHFLCEALYDQIFIQSLLVTMMRFPVLVRLRYYLFHSSFCPAVVARNDDEVPRAGMLKIY